MASVVPSGRSATAVFGNRAWAGAAASIVVHCGFFAVFIYMILHGLVHENVYEEPQVSVVDFEVPPEEPKPPEPEEKPPEPPRPPPEPTLVPHPPPQAIPHSAPPAPAVMAGAGHGGAGGDAMGVGTDTEWHGEQPTPEPPHDIPPPAPEHHRQEPPPPPQPREVDDAELSVHPNIRCSSARIAALYPQNAIDNDAEADIPVEVLVDATGHVVRATARSDPGFGLGAAAEQALLTACRPTAVPLDRNGNPAITRVVHTIRWQLE